MDSKHRTVRGTPIHHQLGARAAAAAKEQSRDRRSQDGNKIDSRGAAGIGDDSGHGQKVPKRPPAK